MRSTPEWVGKNDDSPIPRRVKARVFDKYDGRCYLSGRKIMVGEKWEAEHILALSLGGEHRESNLAPALVDAHKIKTKSDRRIKAKNDRVRKRHIGIRKPSKFSCSRNSKWKKKVNGTVVMRNEPLFRH